MSDTARSVGQAFVSECNKTLDACLRKIEHCLAQLSEDDVWWRPFPEVRAALEEACGRGWKLAILSNTDRDFIEATMQQIGVPFELAIVASEIGSYKPAPAHWERFFERVDVRREWYVHVAQSHFHDVVPAAALGLRTIWINRYGERAEPAPTRELSQHDLRSVRPKRSERDATFDFTKADSAREQELRIGYRVNEVADLVRDFASRFSCATVVGPVPNPPAGVRLQLSCSAPRTARVILYPSDDDINVHMGEATWIELFKQGRNRAERVQEVRRILEAVVGGRYEETIWQVRGKTIRSKARLYTPEGDVFLKPREWRGLASILPDPRASRTHIQYDPYV